MSINSPDDIRPVLEGSEQLSDDVVQGFLDDANLVVSENLGGLGYSDARLKTIEKYLALHFGLMLIERGGLTSSRIADSEDTYIAAAFDGQTGFMMSRYGQQAVTLDTSGTLRKLSAAKLKAQFQVIRPRACMGV